MNSPIEKQPDDISLGNVMVVLASFVILVAGMKAASSILVPFLLAVFIAIITTPIFIGLQNKGIPSIAALLALIMGLIVVCVLMVGVIGTSLSDFTNKMPAYQQKLQKQTTDVMTWLKEKGVDTSDDIITDAFNPQAIMGYVGSLVSTLSGLLSNAFLILLIVIFMLLEAAILPIKVRELPGLSKETSDRLDGVVENIRQYMGLKTVISLFTGLLIGALMAAMGVDFAILLGLLAFLLNYVPSVGSIIAAIPGVLLAVVQFGFTKALIVAGIYMAINVTVGNVIEPRVMGRGLGLSPMVIVLSMIFWGWVLGPVGMLLSVPLTMAVKIGLESGSDTRWIALLMGAAPARKADKSC